jgi:hypothetical protein
MLRTRRSVALVALAFLLPSASRAQRLEDARVAITIRGDGPAPERRDAAADRSDALFKRTLAGFGGTLVGGALGFLGGYVVYGKSHHVPCGDFCIPAPIAIGTLAGALVGTGLAVTIPDYKSDCAWRPRFARGLGGAVAGLVAGSVLALTQIGALALPVMPAFGAALAQGRC